MQSEVKDILSRSWVPGLAENSLSHWLDVARRESWTFADEVVPLLALLFGTSWYFTRFIYYRGEKIIPLFEMGNQSVSFVKNQLEALKLHDIEPLEEMAQKLRIKKNEIMLSILLLQLQKKINQAEVEMLLTELADVVLNIVIRLFLQGGSENQLPCVVIGMGRLASHEMNYGSDLDVIIISTDEDIADSMKFTADIRRMLRCITTSDPAGVLYPIDMRLRPHGSSGTLITSMEHFINFHQQERGIWERQMMTRWRFVYGNSAYAERLTDALHHGIYRQYEQNFIADEITATRMLVETEFSRNHKNKIDLKRSSGGIMDIDFIAHFLQLNNGVKHPEVRSLGTRKVLEFAGGMGLLADSAVHSLLVAYDFFKFSEAVLRLFDMTPSSQVKLEEKTLLPLARATQCLSSDSIVNDYLRQLDAHRSTVRTQFEAILQCS